MATTRHDCLESLVSSSPSRRQFAQRLAAAGAFVGVTAGSTTDIDAAAINDLDILNFALNLEYLEAEFYTVGTTGRRIADLGIGIDGRGRSGGTIGGARVAFDTDIEMVMRELADDEQKHVVFLRGALRGAAVAKPTINLEALGLGFRNQTEFLILARAFEDVGVSAYGGAAPLVRSKPVLSAAARIALTEAQHAGAIRRITRALGLAIPALDALDVPPPPAGPKAFAVDDAGLTIVRTPAQVLSIAYASSRAGTTRGGFYPDGVNGTIASV
jgi:hypothetical protein